MLRCRLNSRARRWSYLRLETSLANTGRAATMARVKVFAAFVLSLVIVEALAGVPEIRALYQQINASIQTKPTRQVLLFASGEPGKYQWRSVGEKGGQEEFKKSDYRAQAYFQGDRLVKAVLETKSQSGDWKFTEEYYFYDSG